MSVVFVFEQFLRERYPGWRVPAAVAHVGRLAFVWRPDDSIAIPQHGMTVNRAEHDAWLHAGHDAGDEDRS